MRLEVVRGLAEQAVRDRLGDAYISMYGTLGCVRAVRDWGDGHVLVHLNSGGNALSVQRGLQEAGYRCVPGPTAEYGCTILVSGQAARCGSAT